jgi:hypothetical protein
MHRDEGTVKNRWYSRQKRAVAAAKAAAAAAELTAMAAGGV